MGTEMVNSLPHVKIGLELSLLSSGYSLLGLEVKLDPSLGVKYKHLYVKRDLTLKVSTTII